MMEKTTRLELRGCAIFPADGLGNTPQATLMRRCGYYALWQENGAFLLL